MSGDNVEILPWRTPSNNVIKQVKTESFTSQLMSHSFKFSLSIKPTELPDISEVDASRRYSR